MASTLRQAEALLAWMSCRPPSRRPSRPPKPGILLGADLSGTDLHGASLTMANYLLQQQLDAAQGDDHPKLAVRRQRPAHWSASPARPPMADQ